MSSREPFGIGLQNMPGPYNSDGPSFYQAVGVTSSTQAGAFVTNSPVAGNGVVSDADGEQGVVRSGNMGGSGINMNTTISEDMKRKRGRPRKYGPGPDATMALALTPTPSTAAVSQSSGGYSAPIPPSTSSTSFKKRGRPLGSGKKQQMEAFGSLGTGFTPHVITVMAGEDVSSKIMSFSQQGTRAICVLSANGAISNVTLRQAATSGGSVTYEGRFEILSLSGSFLLSENGGARSRTGGLSVSLSGPDGRVLGGSVAGLLTAASPVQVIVGSFNTDGRKESKSRHQMDPLFAQPKLAPCSGPTGANSPPSRGTLSESSGGPGSPLNLTTEACNNSNPHGMSSMPWK